MVDVEEIPVPGVSGLDHTADVGFEIHAPDLPALFHRAALALVWLVLERSPSGVSTDGAPSSHHEVRKTHLVEEDLPSLLRSWLRSVLLWDEVHGFVVADTRMVILPTPVCGSEDGQGVGLQAEAMGCFDSGNRVREIKGVTLHGLHVERKGEGWFGRVIFDV